MSPLQRLRREKLERRYGRPKPGAVRDAFSSLVRRLPLRPAHVIADDDPAIRAATRNLADVTLEVHPNPQRGPRGTPRSPAARARDRAMFPNDQLHRFLRHTEAAHRRETIAFGRSFNALVERLALFIIWRNLVQARSERRPAEGTTAMRLGLTLSRWSWERVFARRLQPSKVDPPEEVWRTYRRLLSTPPLAGERRHNLSLAF